VARPSKAWRKKAKVYLWFARQYPDLDRSEEAAERMYDYESRGIGAMDWSNAYFVGKHWLDCRIAAGKECLKEGTALEIEEQLFWLWVKVVTK
jgi:hypothetical protein